MVKPLSRWTRSLRFPGFELPTADSEPYVAGDRPAGTVPNFYKTDRSSYESAIRGPALQDDYDSRSLHVCYQRMSCFRPDWDVKAGDYRTLEGFSVLPARPWMPASEGPVRVRDIMYPHLAQVPDLGNLQGAERWRHG